MPVRMNHTLALLTLTLVMLSLRNDALGNEVRVTGPGGEATSNHAANQVQVWSCQGSLHNCHISQSGKVQAKSYVDRDGVLTLPKYRPRTMHRSRGRH
jgi:hypothetical protein